jgi:hypothetical protein
MILELSPPTPGAVRHNAAAFALIKAHGTAWSDQDAPSPDDSAISSPAFEFLHLIHHNTEAAHCLPRSICCILMGWCRHLGGSLENFLQWGYKARKTHRSGTLSASKIGTSGPTSAQPIANMSRMCL